MNLEFQEIHLGGNLNRDN